MNEVVVEAVKGDLARRRKASVLEQIRRHREEAARRFGPAEDSTPYIRQLRDGRRHGE